MVAATEAPIEFIRDTSGRPHCATGPAVRFRGGMCRWYWHGVELSQAQIEAPATEAQITSERNAEIKRCLIERFGMAEYLAASGASEVQRDGYGILYRNAAGLQFVRVVDGSMRNGVRREYVIGVASDATTAHEAVAGTYGLTASEYHPAVRT